MGIDDAKKKFKESAHYLCFLEGAMQGLCKAIKECQTLEEAKNLTDAIQRTVSVLN